MPVTDNQLVKKGDLLMEIDPSHYRIAVQQAQANVAARQAELRMRRADAARRADLDSLVVSKEQRENAVQTASTAEAQLQQAQAALDAAKLNLERTRVVSPASTAMTNLNVHRGDYANAGAPKLAIVDSHSFWVYGYFEDNEAAARARRRQGGNAPDERRRAEGSCGEHLARHLRPRQPAKPRTARRREPHVQLGAARAARVPVRIHIDEVPQGMVLSAGTTCTVVIAPSV